MPRDLEIRPIRSPAYVFISYHYQEPDRGLAQVCADVLRRAEPGGVLDADTRFHIQRPADAEALAGIQKNRTLLTLRGARQAGKTSLILQVHVAVSGAGGESVLRRAFVDMHAIPLESLQSLRVAWRYLAEEIAVQLNLSLDWKGEGNHERGVQRFLKDRVFTQDDTPLLICLDEVSRLFSTSLRQEFYASLRACYNIRYTPAVWDSTRQSRPDWAIWSTNLGYLGGRDRYRRALQGKPVADDEQDPLQNRLRDALYHRADGGGLD